MNRLILFASLAAALATSAGSAQAAGGARFQYSTPAVGGYDVVSYQTGEKPLRGNGNHIAVYDGVTYLFVNEANRKSFERDPDRYVPAYGGYCAYGVAVGKKFVADPDVWAVVDGRLYLNLDTKVQGLWSKDVPGSIAKADDKWPTLRDKNPAAL